MRPNRTARCLSLVTAIALALAFAQPAPAQYTVTDLLPFNAMLSEARAINSSGQVVGYAYGQDADGIFYSCGFLWENGQSTNLFAQYPEIQAGSALDINDQGQVTGYCYTDRESAFIWQDGVLTLLAPLPGDSESEPIAINNAGQVIGYSMKPQEQDPYSFDYRACLWQNGMITDISACGMEYVRMIDDSGRVIGQTADASACMWQDGAMTLLDPNGVLTASVPTDINAVGQVAGCGYTADSRVHAFIWLPEAAYGLVAGINDIGGSFDAALNPSSDPALTVTSIAYCISDSGQVFGEAAVSSYDAYGNENRSMQLWVWENGTVNMIPVPGFSINTIVGTGSGVVAGSYMTTGWESASFCWSRETGLETVPCLTDGSYACLNDINEAGQIVGTCDAPVSISGYTYNMSHAFMVSKPQTVASVLPVSEATLVRHGRTCQVRVKIMNPGTTPVSDVTIIAVTLGDATPLASLPVLFGTINPGASKQCTLQFKNIPSGSLTLELEGACSLGKISTAQQVTAP